MKKTTPYLLALLVLIGASALLFNQEILSPKAVALEDALVRVNDMAGIDFYPRYQKTTGAEYYDLPISQYVAKTISVNLVGDYKKAEMFLTSSVTRYVDSADPHLEDAKKAIANNLGNSQIREEFVPEFEASSSYQYRQCARAKLQNGMETYMCVVSSVIRENYLFTFILNGNGTIAQEELENILERALKGKQQTLESLP